MNYRGEKKDKDSAAVVFYVNKNKGDTRLTDGIGTAVFSLNLLGKLIHAFY